MEVPKHDLGTVDVVKFANLAITLLNNKVYFPYHDNIFISMESYFVKLII